MTPRTRQQIVLIFSTIILLLSIIVPLYRTYHDYTPKAVGGVMDLSLWNQEVTSTVKLDGEWEFYWNQLLEPVDFNQPSMPPADLLPVPANWDAFEINGEQLSINGYATYRLRIHLPLDKGTYGIKTSNIRASNRIFINGKLIGSSGNPAKSPEMIEHQNVPYTGFFELSGHEVEVIVQVASFKSFNTGIVQSISLGDQQAISRLRDYNMALDGAVSSGFLCMAVYFFGLYVQRKSNKELLYFSLSCFCGLAYSITHSERLLMQLIPHMEVIVQLWIEDISSILTFSFFSRYVYHSFPYFYSKRIIKLADWVAVGLIAAVLFTSASYYAPYIVTLMLFTFILMLINSYYLGIAIKRKVEGSPYLILSIICIYVILFVNCLNNIWKLDQHLFLPVSQPILFISLALYMSQTYTNAYRVIEDLTGKLSKLDKLKDEFLAKTSHELKTPLNGIINISQSLLDGAGGTLKSAHADDLRLVRDIGKRLATLVHDILDYSKMKNHDLQLDLVHLDIHMVANMVMELFVFVINGKPIKIVSHVPLDTYYVHADENRLLQILYNLVDNAVKYTREGTIIISAELRGEWVYISVQDTGIGIPEGQFKEIFKSFEQLEVGVSRRTGGVGLGLPIVDQLVELHGGHITVESTLGEGTQMTFSLPMGDKLLMDHYAVEGGPVLDIYQPKQIASLVNAVVSEGNGTHRILIVDDEYSNIKALLNVLTLEDYQVTAVGSGEEALLVLEDNKFDLCILDVMMPGMTGYEVCRKVRYKYTLLELPVLLITAKPNFDALATGFSVGANDFLEKPYDSSELRLRVRTLVQLKQAAEELVHKEMAFLQAQIKPHFIYNTLNTILSFSYTDHEKARRLLLEFSTYLRNYFDFNQFSECVPLDKEMSLLRAYVEIEKARFGDMLEISFQVDRSISDYQIPSLTVQPLVENAIHHGIMKKEDGGWVKVTASLDSESWLRIEVADNGVGMSETHWDTQSNPDKKREGIGLVNIHKRLLALYGRGLEIKSQSGRGTTVTLHVPVQSIVTKQ